MAGTSSKFLLSPHKLVLCVLLNAMGAPRTSSSCFVALSSSSRQRLALLLLQFFKSSGNLLEPTYEELEENLESALGTGCLISEEVRTLLVRVASVEDLSNLFLGLRELLAPAQSPVIMVIDRVGEGEQLTVELGSTLGIFLRRCILSFNQLPFEGACKLLREMQSYGELAALGGGASVPSETPLTRYFQQHQFLDEGENDATSSFLKSPSKGIEGRVSGSGEQRRHVEAMETFERRGDSATGLSGTSGKGDSSKKKHFLRTSWEVEEYLSEQAITIERKRAFERIATDELVERLYDLKELAFHVPQVHYLQHLNCLYQKDYPAAMESLHRFFDVSAGDVSMPANTPHYDFGNGRLQAGLLGLGQMHSLMGHIAMALQALNESILIAQQNNDNGCLLHALAALCNLFSEVGICTDDDERCKWITHAGLDTESIFYPAPEQNVVGLLKRCLRRALELRLPQLIGFGRLALAKIKLQHVHKIGVVVHTKNALQFGTSPVEVCRILRVNGSLLGNFENSFRINSGVCHGRNAHTDLASAGGQGLGISASLGPTGWGWWKPNEKLGSLGTSVLKLGGTSQLLRASCWEHFGSEPLVRASVLVLIACYADAASADDLSLAYVKVVKLLIILKGHSASQDSLALIGKRFSLLSKSRVTALQLKCRIEWALLQGDLHLAQMACTELSALASVVPGVDMAIKIQASTYKVQTQLAALQYKEATLSAQRLFLLCFKGNMQQESIELLLLIADIHKKAGNAVTGLPYVLTALTLCQSLNLDLLQASATVSLAELWVDFGICPGRRALVRLQQCMPVILGHGSLQLRAQAHLAIAHCYLGDPSFQLQTEPSLVLDPLQVAVEHTRMMEDRGLAIESLYLQAIVLDALGRVAERDEAAIAFQILMLQTQMDLPSQIAMTSQQQQGLA